MRDTVAGKLTILIGVLLIAIFSGAAILNLYIQERGATRILRLNGAQVADMVVGATRSAMLLNDRDEIQRTIDTLAKQRDIERIRVIEKGGRIAYSTERAEVGAMLDTHDEQCISCHQKTTPPESLPTADRARVLTRNGERILGITQTIRNEADCSNAACHVHPPEETLLGVLDVNLEMAPHDLARKESAIEILVASLVGILLVVGATIWTVHRLVHRPVSKLIKETKRIASGDLSARVPEVSNDELGVLAKTFNLMARDLETAREELLEWGKTLEQRVAAKTRELDHAQDQILQAEKMASLGKLAAVVAHEINNPLASVVTYAKIVVRRLKREDDLNDECVENLAYLESIASEATRCGEIVSQLLAFARRRPGQFSQVDVNSLVDKALFLVHHKIELANITTRSTLSEEHPEIVGDPSQIQQALMALLINSCQAMVNGGEISLTTRPTSEGVEIEVADNGPGMTPDVAQHAFEPFYTTKEQGAGVGLGLSVVYGIMQRHGGRVDLDTAPNSGCRFTLFFPNLPPQSAHEEVTS
ncbi:MAG: ATP-binding protein [Acidobacteriota bacterium]